MTDYKPNSHRYKEEQKTTPTERPKIEKVVSNGGVKVKKNEFRKIADTFINEDVSNIKSYLINDVVIPTIKNTIWDAFTNSLNMILFGGRGRVGGNRGPSTSKAPYVSYNTVSRIDDKRYNENSRNDIRSYEDIVFTYRGEAEEVLRRMDEMMDTYKMVRVADFFDLVGMSCDYTYNNYGWTNIRNAEVVPVRGGYKIKFPRAIPIER